MEVENGSGEPVDYTVEQGQGTGGFVLYEPLEAGQSKKIVLMNQYVNVLFYKRGEKEKPLVFRRDIHKDSLVKLTCPARNRWEIEVHPARASVGG